MYWCVVVDGFPNLDEVRRVKDLGFNKILSDGQLEIRRTGYYTYRNDESI